MNKCLNCGKPVHNKYCNVSCQNQYQSKQKLIKKQVEYNNNPKCCLNCGKPLDWDHRNGKFCNSSCAASYNNKLREKISEETKHKISKTLKTTYKNKKVLIVSNEISKETLKEIKRINPNVLIRKEYICKVCGKTYNYIKGKNTPSFCSDNCSKYYKTHRNEFLTEEALKRISEGGRKSAILQGDSKRSKNEIYFYELCKQKFNKVLNNECIFNGWDADIIIEDYKIAILWNGPWHYKKIKEKHSVEQVQNRDKIKISEIQKTGYIPYIIKDMGKYNKSFVEIEFQKFLEYININMAG